VQDDEEVEQKPGSHGPGEEDLPAEEERLPGDQRDHAHVHRVARQPIGAVDDESLRRSPRRRRAAPLKREARRRLQDEGCAEHKDGAAENSKRERLPVRVPPRQEPGDEARHDRRPAEEREAESTGRCSEFRSTQS
jgi:hypothetical protein